jgi:hypothetical protein
VRPVEEGIVAGGGVALLRAQKALENVSGLDGDARYGVDIVKRAIEEPLRQIAANAGAEGTVVCEQVKTMSGNMGYDASAMKFCDLVEAGHHRPDEGDPFGVAERRQRRRSVAHDRSAHRREAGEEEGGRRWRRRHGRYGWNGRHGRHGRHGRLLICSPSIRDRNHGGRLTGPRDFSWTSIPSPGDDDG